MGRYEYNLKKFLEEMKSKVNNKALEEFYSYCITNKLNYRSLINQTISWLNKFNINSYGLTSHQFIDYCNKRFQRIQRLKQEGKHQSIIDLSLYEIYAPSKETALELWTSLKQSKKEKVSSWNTIGDNKKLHDNKSLSFFKKKFGEINGEKLYFENNENHKKTSKRCKEYWIKNSYSEEEAKEKVSKYQTTFSLYICIEKYGEKIGLEIFNNRQSKWQNTLNSKSKEELFIINEKRNIFNKNSYLLRGFSEEEANLQLKNNLENFTRNYSKESITFIQKNLKTNNCFFGEDEWYIYDKENKRYSFYDFTNVNKKIIFEYHGEAFHPNLKLLSEDEFLNWTHPFSKISGKEQLEKDNYKKQLAEKNGFLFFEIYSNDPLELKTSIIEKINGILSL